MTVWVTRSEEKLLVGGLVRDLEYDLYYGQYEELVSSFIDTLANSN